MVHLGKEGGGIVSIVGTGDAAAGDDGKRNAGALRRRKSKQMRRIDLHPTGPILLSSV
jgi:hypothetical protein